MLMMFLHSRQKNLLLMLLAILMVAGFQLVWLFDTYSREERLLRKELSALFRETAFNDFLKHHPDHDTAGIANHPKPPAEEGGDMMIVIRRDSNRIIKQVNPDSSRSGESNLPAEMPVSIYMTADSMTADELSVKFKKSLADEGYVFDVQLVSSKPFAREPEIATGIIYTLPIPLNITMGEHPPMNSTFYRAAVSGYKPFILKRMLPQFALSFLVVFVIVLAFTVLWRNLSAQKRLVKNKDQLVSNITHELKTPVATVSVAIEALQRFDSGTDPQRVREYLDIAGHQLQRLSMLIDKVLRLSMFEGGKIELQRENVNLADLAEEVTKPLFIQLEAAGGKLEAVAENTLLSVYGDKQHLISLLFNLLDNAIKYGGNPPLVKLSLSKVGKTAVIQVQDNGNGIPEEYRKKIFEPFFRIPATGNRHNIKGHGLGLSYVAEIVRLHEGSIEVIANNSGSVFTVKLPLKDE
jgi:two-component system, OmpR family, phosphate regulon sensor histidine kinase PhoR